MKIEVFKHIRTKQDLDNHINFLKNYAVERYVCFEDLMLVENAKYKNLRYAVSTIKDDYIVCNLFVYEGDKDGLFGFCKADSGSTELEEIGEPKYLKLSNIHPKLWLGLCEDLTYEVIKDGVVILEHVQNFNILDLNGCIEFLQLDYQGKTSLICLDMMDTLDGVYCMHSRDEFEAWFSPLFIKRGYEGYLDGVNVSEIFRLYFEVINTIFEVSEFEPIEFKS